MREILFRAKRMDNGEWVKGGSIIQFLDDGVRSVYIPQFNTKCTCTHDDVTDDILEFTNCRFYKVDPETVCQYINENDKDNTMIFENDIVEIPTFKPQCMVIRFLDGVFCLTDKEGKYAADIYYIHHAGINNAKVIGNIFDNPDLLEVSE